MSTTSTKLKCYHCGGIINNETADLVLKKIPLSTKKGIRMYTRKFHMDCVSDFVGRLDVEKETQEENAKWDKCYEYFKGILGIPKGQNLDQHATMRILGLRAGTYVPNGSNVRGIKRGYDFETILTAMKFSSVAISQAFSTMHFKDQKHKIDYAMKIVTNNINFVYSKLEAKNKAEKQLDVVEVERKEVAVHTYVTKAKKDDKVSSLIGKATEDDEIDDLMSLFN